MGSINKALDKRIRWTVKMNTTEGSTSLLSST
jgi:hypothetical protein